MSVRVPVTITITLEGDFGRPEGFSVFGENKEGQWVILGSREIGPFDSWFDVARQLAVLLTKGSGPLTG